MFNNVLIALKKDLNHQALIAVATSAAATSAQMHLVTLIRIAANEDDPLRHLKAAERILKQRADQLQEQGYAASYEAGIVVVAAAADIARIAAERSADLIVIGLAQRSRVGKALLGSDAQRVLLSASCPVLVTHLYEG